MPSRRTLHIVDDDEAVRESAALLLEGAGYRVTTYSSGVEFLEKVDPSLPACVLLDIHMPQMDGLEVQRNLVEREIAFPVIVLTGQGDISIAVRAMKSGAFEFLEKPFRNDLLLEAVQDAFVSLEATAVDRAMGTQAKAKVANLTNRETEVLQALLAGLPNKLTAHELGISVRTVEIYRASVMDKLDSRSLSAAVRTALSAGVEPWVLDHRR